MRFKEILRVSNFIHVNEVKMTLQDKDEHFSSTGNIYNDLMKLQQALINNKYSGLEKLMSYFMWTQEQDTRRHVKNQIKIMYILFYIN
jgi:galactokinase/mevalonate kinase-like predicted kinase